MFDIFLLFPTFLLKHTTKNKNFQLFALTAKPGEQPPSPVGESHLLAKRGIAARTFLTQDTSILRDKKNIGSHSPGKRSLEGHAHRRHRGAAITRRLRNSTCNFH